MPEHRHYIVTRVQEVKVFANEPGDAARIADAVFIKGGNSQDLITRALGDSVYGGVESLVRDVRIEVNEARIR